MAILLSNEIIEAIKKELGSATTSIKIITAYCKSQTFELLNGFISDNVIDKRLLVRFRLDDLLKKSTDFDVVKYAMSAGWKVYIRFDLHIKTYIVDNKRGLVGSANATNSGLNIGKAGNMEMATLIDIDDVDIDKIEKLFDDAIFVTDEIVKKMEMQLASIPEKKQCNEIFSWDASITNLFIPRVDTLFSYELPENFEIVEGEYFSFLDYSFDGDYKRLKEVFRWSNAYLWLLELIKKNDGEMYFGAISASLHNTLVSDPKPYRRDVKQMLSNLLKLIELLGMDELFVDRPNYSQRVRLKQE